MEKARIINNNGYQTIQLPKSVHLNCSSISINQISNDFILFSEDNAIQNMKESLDMFSEDFMTNRNQPPIQTREEL